MKIERRVGTCRGALRLSAIDVGFDLRCQQTAVELPGDAAGIASLADESGPHDQTGVGYEDSEGRQCQIWGTPDEIARELARSGYMVIAARTPNGREVRCEPKNPEVFVCQPPNDNYWDDFPSIAAALAQFDRV